MARRRAIVQSLSWSESMTVTVVVAVAFELELLQVSVKVVVDLSGRVIRGPPVAPSFVKFKPPPVIAQEVGFAAMVVALQLKDDVLPSS
jgi:hypothetical protein